MCSTPSTGALVLARDVLLLRTARLTSFHFVGTCTCGGPGKKFHPQAWVREVPCQT